MRCTNVQKFNFGGMSMENLLVLVWARLFTGWCCSSGDERWSSLRISGALVQSVEFPDNVRSLVLTWDHDDTIPDVSVWEARPLPKLALGLLLGNDGGLPAVLRYNNISPVCDTEQETNNIHHQDLCPSQKLIWTHNRDATPASEKDSWTQSRRKTIIHEYF